MLIKNGLPYEVVYGAKPQEWPRTWLDAAAIAFSEMINPMTGE
jgi:hypothetical protein